MGKDFPRSHRESLLTVAGSFVPLPGIPGLMVVGFISFLQHGYQLGFVEQTPCPGRREVSVLSLGILLERPDVDREAPPEPCKKTKQTKNKAPAAAPVSPVTSAHPTMAKSQPPSSPSSYYSQGAAPIPLEGNHPLRPGLSARATVIGLAGIKPLTPCTIKAKVTL